MAPKAPLGIALSGGADSTALALIAARALGAEALRAATVDHRLRPESREEAEVAGRIAASLGIPHEILTWQEAHQDRAPTGEGGGNLQARARTARQGLLADWARTRGLSAVLLGHTMDDQAETVLMRLERGSGADGLAGMAARVEIGGMVWLRPLLDLRRADLRDLLRAEGLDWTEDPSNQDPGFDRIRIRGVIKTLGLDVERLARTAQHLARQRRVLEADRDRLAARAARIGAAGEVLLNQAAMHAAEEDTRLAVLADALSWIGHQPYRPRFRALTAVWTAETAQTLAGCMVMPGEETLTICREPAACPPPEAARDGLVWDGRWKISGPCPAGLVIGAAKDADRDAILVGVASEPGTATPAQAMQTAPVLSRSSPQGPPPENLPRLDLLRPARFRRSASL